MWFFSSVQDFLINIFIFYRKSTKILWKYTKILKETFGHNKINIRVRVVVGIKVGQGGLEIFFKIIRGGRLFGTREYLKLQVCLSVYDLLYNVIYFDGASDYIIKDNRNGNKRPKVVWSFAAVQRGLRVICCIKRTRIDLSKFMFHITWIVFQELANTEYEL